MTMIREYYKNELAWFVALNVWRKCFAVLLLVFWGLFFVSLCSDSLLLVLCTGAPAIGMACVAGRVLPEYPINEDGEMEE